MKPGALEKIKRATQELPEQFIWGTWYSKEKKCYCYWSWVAKRLGRDVAVEPGLMLELWTWLENELGIDDLVLQLGIDDLVLQSDRIIISEKGKPAAVHARIMELLEAPAIEETSNA